MSGWAHPPWSNLPRRFKGLIVVGLPVLALILLAVPLLVVQRAQQRAQRAVAHTSDVSSALQQTLTLIIDAETGMRGFVATGNRLFLDPYDRGVQWLPRQLAAVQALVSDNPAQTERLEQVRALMAQRLDLLAALIASPASPEDRMLAGKAIMDRLRAALSVMERTELDLLDRRREDLQTAHTQMWLLIWIGAVLGTVVSVGGTQLLSRGEQEVRRLNEELERRVSQRSADLAVARDSLARREGELEASQRLLQSILDYSPLAIQVKDVAGRYVLVNRETERVLNVTAAEVIGRSARDVMPPRLADAIQANDRAVIEARASRQFEETIVQKDGVRVFASNKFPLFDASGQVTGVCGMSRDITGRKIADDELALAQLEALQANRAKSAFMSQMSHELRTPLNAILGFAQLFEAETLSAEQAENVQQITASGRHLLALINEVLDITRIEAGIVSMSTEPVDVMDVVQSAVEMIRPLAAQRGIVVDVDQQHLPADDTAVSADRQRLKQVLINLLSNAVKYNRPDGRITVGFETRESLRLRIRITDTGAGIPPSKLKLLFQPFERAGADRAIEGTGLGLALSRAICHSMGSTLGVDSVIDHGSTFWVELALAKPAAHADHLEPVAPPAATAAVEPVRPSTILYIEDNLSNFRLMQRVLARRPGVTLLYAPDGPAGLALIRERRPDLVLLDLHLPQMSGEEVLERLCDDPESRHLPVVVLTADATPSLPRRLASLGAAGVLTKPLDLTLVLQTIDGLLRDRLEAHERI